MDLHSALVARTLGTPAVDVARMRRARHTRLQAEMARAGVDVAVLLHAPHVAYATGLARRGVDVTHASFDRPVAVVVAGSEQPHLLWHDDGPDAAAAHRHPAAWPELDEGAARLALTLREIVGGLDGLRVAVDEQTGAMLRAGVLDGSVVVDAAELVGAAKLTKTADELACIAIAQTRNERAMVAAQAAARPGATRSDVAGAFLAALCEPDAGDPPHSGAGAPAGAVDEVPNLIDPIFQVMPRSVADGPRTTTGGVAFPTGVGDPTLATGDLVWVDSGIDHLGYASDFGRTWIVGRDPTPAEHRLFTRWCQVMLAVLDVLAPGATAGDLCRAAEAADADPPPWLPHFYLAHGVGIESAEMPLVGTDLGRAFDDRMTMAPGTVLVFEPVVWEDGVGGYRAEEIVAVTDDGWCHLGGGHAYPPFAP
jgi:Xaa-Pro dipeptidase